MLIDERTKINNNRQILIKGDYIIMNKKVFMVGCGSRGRIGKDTLAKCLFSLFELNGIDCQIYSLANALKSDVQSFLQEKFQYNVWTNDTEEKVKFRDFLVWYGKQRREASNGTYWTDIVEKQILQDSQSPTRKYSHYPFVAIVPDIRYSYFEKDEAEWVQSNPNWTGKLIHVTRFNKKLNSKELNRNEFPPLNTDEAENDPKIKDKANYKFMWDTMGEFPSKFFNSEYHIAVEPLFNNLLKDIQKI
jgi:hypothetical protein